MTSELAVDAPALSKRLGATVALNGLDVINVRESAVIRLRTTL